jgi:hypothetical protein
MATPKKNTPKSKELNSASKVKEVKEIKETAIKATMVSYRFAHY